MMFTTKKRARKDAWRTLQSELDEREKLEEDNAVKLKKLDKLKARVCIEEEPNPAARHAYLDIEIGRRMGKDPMLTKGRIIVELFDDIMPRTVDTFVDLLNSENEPTYRGSQVSKIFPGYHMVAGDRDLRMEGVSAHTRENVYSRVEQEANWSVPHLNPGVLSLRDLRSSRFQITFRKAEELDGWHAVFGKVVYGFDMLKVISEQGNTNGEPKQPVTIVTGGAVPAGTHPREYLRKLEQPDDPEAHGYNKKVMRYSSTYRHTGLIGH
uniref:Peptidyl-prolyl cis-trans isomerase n=1 Tax=Coccolithus braarudii TaxID=221442 RepID=A0A7S0Q182_9EUKA|mmetsp:Transcript_31342/g.67389  ORF Transcript_31342/g.67389 Transcript_31342/m.67389 type:complete len:267 (+) Transcript_31342:73-873(+)